MALRMQSPEKRREKANPVSRDKALRAHLLSADTDNEEIDFFYTRAGGQKAQSMGPGGEAFNYQVKENLTGRLHV